MALDTLSNVKTALAVTGSGDDTLLTQLQTVADSFVETFCGRSFTGGTFTEYHDGAIALAFLTNYPLLTVTDVRVSVVHEFDAETVLPTDRYVVHKARGVIECLDGPFVPTLPGFRLRPNTYPEAVKVVYTTAADSVPPLVCQGYTELIGHWFRQAKTHAATGQLNVIEEPGADGVTVYPWDQSMGYKVPTSVKELLAPFRVPSM